MKYFATVVLLAMLAVASTHAEVIRSEEKNELSPENAEKNIQSVILEKRSLNGDIEGKIAASEAKEKRTELTERNKRTAVFHTAAPVAYTAYSSPYTYARNYVYPYVASPYVASPYVASSYVASPYVASPYRTYPYIYNSPYYF